MRTFGCVSAWKYDPQFGSMQFLADCAQQNALLELKNVRYFEQKISNKTPVFRA